MPEPVEEQLQVVVDREICIGSGMCVVYAPGTFVQGEDTKAVVQQPGGDAAAAVLTAVEACPTGALAVAGDEGEV